MADITVSEIQDITKEANDSVLFATLKYPFLDSYKELNKLILEEARNGKNSISFDFIDNFEDKTKSVQEMEKSLNRIYISTEFGQAIYDVYNYPNYLLSKGFQVEIRKSFRQHGYNSKSYYISW